MRAQQFIRLRDRIEARTARKFSDVELEGNPPGVILRDRFPGAAEVMGGIGEQGCWAIRGIMGVSSSFVSAVIASRSGTITRVRLSPTADDEALINRLVTSGHPSRPAYNDPEYLIEGVERGRRGETAGGALAQLTPEE